MKPTILSITIITVLALTHGIHGTSHAGEPSANHVLGMNLFVPVDWSRAMVFTNIFQESRPWIAQTDNTWDTGATISVGPNGYPLELPRGQCAATLMKRGLQGRYPSGDYLALWEGAGTVVFPSEEFDTTETIKVIASGDGETTRALVPVKAGSLGILLQIRDTDPNDPIRNIRLITPGFHDTYKQQLFHPAFLDSIRPYSVLRFMDWQHTNHHRDKKWRERTTPSTWSQAGTNGVAVEHMITLCNDLRSSPWFCMPDGADATYIREFAGFVRDHLDPELQIYVEYSNEVWNSGFPQAQVTQARGAKRWPSIDAYEARMRQYSESAVETFVIWEEVFGGAERLVRVLAAQHANPWTSKTILNWNRAAEHADALAVAPYWGYPLADPRSIKEVGFDVRKASTEQILEYAEKHISDVRELTRKHAGLAKQYDLSLIAYEAGQHMAPVNAGPKGDWTKDSVVIENLSKASRHPRMRTLYTEYVHGWREDGGSLLVHYMSPGHSFGRWGSFSIREFQDDPPSPKELGLLDALLEIHGGTD